jgi:hypothetical protein
VQQGLSPLVPVGLQVSDLPSEADVLAQLEVELQQLRQLAAANSSSSAGGGATPADAAAAALAGAEDRAPGSSGSSSGSVQLLWAAKYAPLAASQLCGNAAAGAELHGFLADWKARIEVAAAGQLPGRRLSAASSGSEGSWLHEAGYSDDSMAAGAPGQQLLGLRRPPAPLHRINRPAASPTPDLWPPEPWRRHAASCAAPAGDDAQPSEPKAIALCGPPGCGKTAAAFAVAQVRPANQRGTHTAVCCTHMPLGKWFSRHLVGS